MARWSFVVADTSGSHLSDLIHAHSRSLTWSLSGPATCSWSTSGDDPGALATVETATDLMAYRDDALMFRGRVGSSQDELDGTKHTITWSAADYQGLLDRRLIWEYATTSWTATDQATIAWGLIDGAQTRPNGAMGITNASAPTGVLRDRTYDYGKPVGEALQQLAEVIDGFDWDISPELAFRLWYPTRGTQRDWAAVYGDTVGKVTRSFDTSTFANYIYGTGGEVDGAPLISRVGVTTPPGPEGRWDLFQSWSDVTILATLQDHTAALLADSSTIRPTYELTIRQGAWTPDDAWLGDTTPLVIRSGRLDITEPSGRIQQVKIDIDDNDVETVTLSYGRRPVTLVDRLQNSNSKIATLSRR